MNRKIVWQMLLIPTNFLPSVQTFSQRLRQGSTKYFFVLTRLPEKNISISPAAEIKTEGPGLQLSTCLECKKKTLCLVSSIEKKKKNKALILSWIPVTMCH